jgi:ATP adenylyltransferase
MDHLWSPWRYGYISQIGKSDRCVFCEIAKGDPAGDRESLILYRGRFNFILLNKFPYTVGHALIVPFAHLADFPRLGSETLHEMMGLAQAYQTALEAVYNPDGYNWGMNLGQSAGAGVRDHLHLHIVARWMGSDNFMPVIGETRLLPEDLASTYNKLAARFRP